MILRIEKHFKAEQAARKKAEELLQQVRKGGGSRDCPCGDFRDALQLIEHGSVMGQG